MDITHVRLIACLLVADETQEYLEHRIAVDKNDERQDR